MVPTETDDDLGLLRASLREFFAVHYRTSDLAECDPTSEYSGTVWKPLTEQLALSGLHIPEEYGGQGYGFEELGVALEESGRVLLRSPFFASTCLAARPTPTPTRCAAPLRSARPRGSCCCCSTPPTSRRGATISLSWRPGT